MNIICKNIVPNFGTMFFCVNIFLNFGFEVFEYYVVAMFDFFKVFVLTSDAPNK